MLEHEILVAEQFLTGQSKKSCDLQYYTLVLIGLDGRVKRPDPINRLVMSNPSTYVIVPIVFFKLLLLQKTLNPFYFRGARRWWLRVNHVKKNKRVVGMTLPDDDAPVLKFGKYRVPIQYHSFQVNSDPELNRIHRLHLCREVRHPPQRVS